MPRHVPRPAPRPISRPQRSFYREADDQGLRKGHLEPPPPEDEVRRLCKIEHIQDKQNRARSQISEVQQYRVVFNPNAEERSAQQATCTSAQSNSKAVRALPKPVLQGHGP